MCDYFLRRSRTCMLWPLDFATAVKIPFPSPYYWPMNSVSREATYPHEFLQAVNIENGQIIAQLQN
jgi:hypothetical protein